MNAKKTLKQIFAIAAVTFQELLREKILWSSVLFSILALTLVFAISRLSFVDQARVAVDVGLASIAIVGGLISIIMGSVLIAKEVQNRTLYLVLTKAIWRWQFVVGKVAGLLAIIALNMFFMGGAVLAISGFMGGVIGINLFYCLFLFFIEFAVLASMAVIFSSFSTGTLAAVFTSGIWVIGHAMQNFQILIEKIEPEWMQPVFRFASQVLPDLTRFDLKPQVSHSLLVDWTYVAASTGYGLIYILFALSIACAVFSRRDL